MAEKRGRGGSSHPFSSISPGSEYEKYAYTLFWAPEVLNLVKQKLFFIFE